VGIVLEKLARGFAILGGMILCFLALLVVISILGRMFFLLPVPGDFEIVGIGTAIAIFLCLPYCQLRRGHVTVDIFSARVPKRIQDWLDTFAGVVFALISLLFAWQMIKGLRDMYTQSDMTIIVGIPLWIAFPFGIVSFLLLSLCCLFTAHNDLGDRRYD